jgi:glutamate transport system substrate-binding protein
VKTFKKTMAVAAAMGLSLAMTACGDADSGGSGSRDVEANTEAEFPEGSTMAELNEQGSITIGVKFDQPGIGFKGASDDVPSGFDIEIGKILAAELGIAPEDIDWELTVSDNREPYLQQNKVDLVIASYSITDERREVVGQAGPYYVTGQQLLVAADNEDIAGPEDIKGEEVCSVTGSTSIETVEKEYGAVPRGFDTYSECVEQVRNGSVDAMTTDGAILLGYAAEDPDNLKVVGDAFSEERYGIGYPKEQADMCEFINETLEKSFEDGSWQEAFDVTLGQAGVDAPDTPELDPCQ